MNVVLPLRAEFGLKLWWFVPAVHAIDGPKVVYIEPGEEALYPSADHLIEVDRQRDSLRRNRYMRDADFVRKIERHAAVTFPGAELVKPDGHWPRKRFVPRPFMPQGVTADVVVCPRKRAYGAEKNWPHWVALTEGLRAEGLNVFAGGVEDSSFWVPCARAWDYGRGTDATIEAILAARLVVATDAGLAHLAVLCGRPLLMITHGEGIVAPGPVSDEHGHEMEPAYWPVKLERYTEANHTGSPISVIYHAWENVDVTIRAVLERC